MNQSIFMTGLGFNFPAKRVVIEMQCVHREEDSSLKTKSVTPSLIMLY